MLLSTSIFCLLLPSASIHSHLLPATSIYFWSAPIYPQIPPSSPICFCLLPSTSISCLPHLLPLLLSSICYHTASCPPHPTTARLLLCTPQPRRCIALLRCTFYYSIAAMPPSVSSLPTICPFPSSSLQVPFTPSVDPHLPSVTCCLLPAACHLLHAACCLLPPLPPPVSAKSPQRHSPSFHHFLSPAV